MLRSDPREEESRLENKVDNLDSADDRKSSKKTHRASYGRQHVHKLGFSVLQNDSSHLAFSYVKIDYHCYDIKSRAPKKYFHEEQFVLELVIYIDVK